MPIACEDTRQTQKLLNHYAVSTRTISYHEHNEMTRATELVKQMQGLKHRTGHRAGMPGISDPGFRLISLAIQHNLPVVPIPGASAFLTALVASGLPTDSFRFSGFLPAKRGERMAALEAIRTSPRTQVFYEAPHRIVEAISDVVETLGKDRQVVIAREVTSCMKIPARTSGRGVGGAENAGQVKGEITLIIGKPEESDAGRAADSPVRRGVRQRIEQIMAEQKIDEKAALKKVAKERAISKSQAYRELQRTK